MLLAEDNRINQQLALAILEKDGHQVTVASNGHAAVEAMQAGPFDVVLMDIQMPGMDGMEAKLGAFARFRLRSARCQFRPDRQCDGRRPRALHGGRDG